MSLQQKQQGPWTRNNNRNKALHMDGN